MSRYQTALLEILANGGLEDCLSPEQAVSPSTIAEEVVRLCSEISGQLARLAQFRDYPDLMLMAVDEMMVNADVLRALAAARLKLATAAAEDNPPCSAAPAGTVLH